MSTYETAHTSEWDEFDREHRVDWAASCRLALVVSILAAVAALGFSAFVGETALVVCVIVAASAVSWFHLEHGQLSRPLTRTMPVRRD
jgi:putative Mn2+ efflux pump MntP